MLETRLNILCNFIEGSKDACKEKRLDQDVTNISKVTNQRQVFKSRELEKRVLPGGEGGGHRGLGC